MGLFDFITGGKGDSYQAGAFDGSLQRSLTAEANAYTNNPIFADRVNQYSSGNQSLSDYMSNYGSNNAAVSGLVMDPLAASRLATDQVQNNGVLGQVFGKGGSLDQATNQVKDLSTRGYSLQPEDYEAYGQASNQIAREFGQSENSLAQSLADRGLAGGGGGVVGSDYAGLAGNKTEQLAAQQRGIAEQRMNMNLQRLTNMQQSQANLAQQGANDINQQYGRNAQTVQNRQAFAQNTSNSDFSQFQGLEANKQAQAKDERAAQNPGLFGAVQSGIMSGVSGGIGSSINGGVSSGLSNLFGGTPVTAPTGGANPKIAPALTNGSQ